MAGAQSPASEIDHDLLKVPITITITKIITKIITCGCNWWRFPRQRFASFISEFANRLSGTITTWQPAALVMTIVMMVTMKMMIMMIIMMTMMLSTTSPQPPPMVRLRKQDNLQDSLQARQLQPGQY